MNDERLSDVTQTNPLSLKDIPFLFLSFLLLLLIWRFLQTQTSLTQFGIEKTLVHFIHTSVCLRFSQLFLSSYPFYKATFILSFCFRKAIQ